jgi:predicted amidohydrolase YtcJ
MEANRSMRLRLFLLVIMLSGCSGAEVDFARSLAVPQPADVVLRGGKVVTVDRNFSIKQAIAIKNGRFLAVGSDRDMRLLTGPRTRVIDLAGHTVIPGLIDAQIYASVAALTWDAELRWEQLRSGADGLKRIANAAQSQPAGSWIVIGAGWDPMQFSERRLPTRAELDDVAPNHPLYLRYLDRGALLNSAALGALGITRDSANPPGVRFLRDSKGELTGWLHGPAAGGYIYSKIPRPSLDRFSQGLRDCFHELSRLGVTSIGDIQSAQVGFAHRRILADMARRGELNLRVSFYIKPDAGHDDATELKSAVAEIKQLAQSEWLRFAGFALDLERAMTGSGRTSDIGGGKSGAQEKESSLRIIRFLADGGYAVRLYAGSGAAVRPWLDIVEELKRATPVGLQRVAIQSPDLPVETMDRVKFLDAGIVVQSHLGFTEGSVVEPWGGQKSQPGASLRRLLDADIPMGAGSDGFRTGNYSPMFALWRLVNDQTAAGPASSKMSQNLSREEALRLYTIGAAWLNAESQRKGSIEVDKLADLTVLSADYLTIPHDQIRSLESLLTMVGGRVVYSAGRFAAQASK